MLKMQSKLDQRPRRADGSQQQCLMIEENKDDSQLDFNVAQIETVTSSEPGSQDVNFQQEQIFEDTRGPHSQPLNINVPRSKQRLRPHKDHSRRVSSSSFISGNSRQSKS